MNRMSVHAVTFVAVCVVAMGALSTDAQSLDSTSSTSQASSAQLATTGHSLFITNCAPCHGAQAEGDDGPNLHKLGLTDDDITSTVTSGVKGQMPSFAKKLKDKDLKAVVAYVHSLQ